jgi:hypothetical protein
MCGRVVFAGGFTLGETGNTEIVVGALIVGASDANLGRSCQHIAHRPRGSESESGRKARVKVDYKTYSGSDVC